MNAIVVYTSKYGSTEKYARWIAESLGCRVEDLQNVKKQDLAAYDLILYGGGLYAGRIAGFKKFLAWLGKAENKKLVLFMVGMTNTIQKDFYKKIAEQNIAAEWKNQFEVFSLRGDQLFSKMSGLHRLMMRMPKMIAEKKPPEARTEDDKHFIENFGKDVIFASKEQIEPILDYVRTAGCCVPALGILIGQKLE